MSCEEVRRLVGELFDSFYPSCVRYAFRVTGSLELAEELVQDAFLALYRYLRQGQHVANARGWLFCVVRREMARREDEWKRPREQPQPEVVLRELADHHAGVDVRAVEMDDEVTQLLSLLTEREREVVLLRLQAFKYKEIASELGIGTNSVKTLLARAIRKLRRGATAESKGEGVSLHAENSISKTLQ